MSRSFTKAETDTFATARPLWQRLLSRWAGRVAIGQLTLVFPDGSRHVLRGDSPGPAGVLEVHRARTIGRMLLRGDLGLAESYLDGDWSSPDLAAFLTVGALNMERLTDAVSGMPAAVLVNRIRHRLRANNKRGSRRNVAAHYDLGNDFYRLWLDETMTYSSALFRGRDATLADAQRMKYRRIATALGLGPEDRVLEIGCGWGGFAEVAAQEFGCRVVGITLSTEQAAFARRRVAEAGLGERVEIRLQDYRDLTGTFDKIVSIEMFEAVGEENWPLFMSLLSEHLSPTGLAALQIITIDDRIFESYRRNVDFIQRYIFPGGMLPSPAALRAAVTTAGLNLDESFFFGESYAETLRRWRQRFGGRWPEIEALGFDGRFRRLWTYYLCYCEAGFNAGAIDVGHFVLSRP